MAFRPQTIVGIQITDSSLRLAVGKKSESSLAISHLETFPVMDGNVAGTLNQILKSLKPQNIHLALPVAYVKHYFFSLPPLNKKNALEIVRRELSQASEAALNTLFFDFTIPKKEDKFSDYGVLTASKDIIMPLISEVQRAGKKIHLVSSYPYAILSNLKRFFPSFEEKICASLHLEETAGLISIFNKGSLVFTRNFSFKTKIPLSRPQNPFSPQEEAPANPHIFQRILQETNRSLLFFKQHSHGLMVESLFLSGDLQNAQALQNMLGENLGIEVLTCPPARDQILLDTTKALPGEELEKYAIPIGILLPASSDVPNLVPETILKRGKIFWGRLAFILITFCLLAGMGTAHFTLTRQEAILKDTISSQSATRQKMLPIINNIRKIKKYRKRYLRISRFSKEILHAERFWTPFFQDISHIIPDNIFLEQTDFQSQSPLQGTYHFKITGHVFASTVETAQNMYQKFIFDLFSSPYVSNGNFSPPEISSIPIRTKKTATPKKDQNFGNLLAKIEASRKKGATMTFQLDGTLRTSLEKEDPQ